ncbi:hypothetical protein TWF217_005850 [Orbilia oligospora]|nr:hypothetical protein TWF217_005850 [Orbilia oligospora]KAF3270243.1 hypothetical protein TWF128_004049 [Orbilia oligospora]
MLRKIKQSEYLLAAFGFTLAVCASQQSCKCRPSDPCWPAPNDWNQLNDTVNGHLIRTTPPGIACYPGEFYNKTACEMITSVYQSSDLIAKNPYMIDFPGYAGDPCPPNNDTQSAGTTCNGIGWYPAYVINATNVEAVQAGVSFSRKHNIRLIVKSTGHDFLGRSTGAHALSIFTHSWQEAQFHSDFTPEGCAVSTKGQNAVTISPGMQWQDMYRFADEHNSIIVGGGASTVGCIGGFLQGGGHSPLSSIYGLAVDQVLEMKVVLPSGEYITANDYQNQDIYWALRGGGPSTFGVVTSATVKLFPSQPWYTQTVVFNLTKIDTPREIFHDAITYMHTQIPRLNDGGLMGYYFVVNSTEVAGGSKTPTFAATLYMLNGTAERSGKLLAPVLTQLSIKYGKNITLVAFNQTFPSFYKYFKDNFVDYAVTSGAPILASRLLTRRSLTDNVPLLHDTLKLNFETTGILQGHIVAGRGVAQHKNVSMALNPAWRETYSHIIASTGFENNGTGRVEQMEVARYVLEYAWRQLSPNSGAYLSETFINSKFWQSTYWGENYSRLFAIKAKYDPHNVLYCVNCVGSERLIEVNGTLCNLY